MTVRNRRPIPNDWQVSDGFCVLSFPVPNSPQWKATYLGVLSDLESETQWDETTGDPTAAVELVMPQFSDRAIACGNAQVPIHVDTGHVEYASNGVYRIRSTIPSGGYSWMWIDINNDGNDFVDANNYTLTAIPEDYPDDIEIYDQAYNVVGNEFELVDYCDDVGALWLITDAGQFWLNLTIGELCP